MQHLNLRRLFLDYFKKHQHHEEHSSPLIPSNDKTLLFTNAGMVPFKDHFTGAQASLHKRLTSCQKCMRVSGKHNDLEEVGRTRRHHTFFEMLGNFSFGDYFKEEAIIFAWDLIAHELQLPTDKLWITVFGGDAQQGIPADTQARKLWQKISGLPESRILDRHAKDNFWAMGETGPCGPCTEIYVDQGSGPVTYEDFDNGRILEIWNNVFMQFDRQIGGKLLPLPAPCVDTGMGLERLTAVICGVNSNYHTSLFLPLLERTSELLGKPYTKSDSEDDVSFRVIADHARATVFLAADGIRPHHEGRGYVMRRIMRRAIRHGQRLGFHQLFFHDICLKVVEEMAQAYPELLLAKPLLQQLVPLEEETFRKTLQTGLKTLQVAIDHSQSKGQQQISGDIVFTLYDTYGFPKDLTEIIAREAKLSIDEEGFSKALEQQRQRSRQGDLGQIESSPIYKTLKQTYGGNSFLGYFHENIPAQQRSEGTWRQGTSSLMPLQMQCRIKALLQRNENGELVECSILPAASRGYVLLEQTPFYGESGGQVGDKGALWDEHQNILADVLDTQKPLDDLSIIEVSLHQEALQVHQVIWAAYLLKERLALRAHHSATHLLQTSLRDILGDHVAQAGSKVEPTKLRFDFSHLGALQKKEIHAVEQKVQESILADHQVESEETSLEEALKSGAIALFGEKYGERVRVVRMGPSVEFCGGTHVESTQELGLFLIDKEGSVQNGVRRIEAYVGAKAVELVQYWQNALDAAFDILHTGRCRQEVVLQTTSDLQNIEKLYVSYEDLLRYTHQIDEDFCKDIQAMSASLSDVSFAKTSQLFAWLSDTSKLGATEHRQCFIESQNLRLQWQALQKMLHEPEHYVDIEASLQVEQLPPHAALKMLHVRQKQLKLLQQKQQQQAQQQQKQYARQLFEQAQTIHDLKVVASQVQIQDFEDLRTLADAIRHLSPRTLVALASAYQGKAHLLVAATSDLKDVIHAGKLLQCMAPFIGGRGGGKADLAQGGGPDVLGLEKALHCFLQEVKTVLGA